MRWKPWLAARVAMEKLPALLYSHIGQSDDNDGGQALVGIHLDLDHHSFQSNNGARADACQHNVYRR